MIVPELLIVIEPPSVVIRSPLLVKLFPVTLAPPDPRTKFPLMIVDPVPPLTVAEFAMSPWIVMLFDCVTLKAPSG